MKWSNFRLKELFNYTNTDFYCVINFYIAIAYFVHVAESRCNLLLLLNKYFVRKIFWASYIQLNENDIYRRLEESPLGLSLDWYLLGTYNNPGRPVAHY